MAVPRITVPRPVIDQIPRPVVDTVPPPVVDSIQVPVIEVPTTTIEYPTLDVPTQEEYRGTISPPQPTQEVPEEDTRDLPDSPPIETPAVETPTINVPGVGPVPAPEVAPLVTAGATAVVTTGVALIATIVIGQLKNGLTPVISRLLESFARKKKVKIKQRKPLLHYIEMEEGVIAIIEYTQTGCSIKDTTNTPEQYIRDQIDMDKLYEYDNKVIIDLPIKDRFTKEGQKRFKSLFVPSKTIAKKLSAKFSLM